ncbi:hypothetical protein INT80_08290 [Gallibacterium anatis]|uniref:Uncharacterized protein n=1 Tax=Gallibacterium anatis TaxID=750 RepID=A0A930UXS2_9PAST|nr:hypothetical protein [Gallibacterium anatis]
MNGSYWNAIQTTAIQAYQGDQKALEDVSGLIIGILTPTVKGISNKETLDNFAYRVPEPLDSTKNLPVVGESLGYEKQLHILELKVVVPVIKLVRIEYQ